MKTATKARAAIAGHGPRHRVTLARDIQELGLAAGARILAYWHPEWEMAYRIDENGEKVCFLPGDLVTTNEGP